MGKGGDKGTSNVVTNKASPKAESKKDASQPPSDLTPAQLRAWQRRQKILNRGENRLETLTGARDYVAQESQLEFSQEPGEDKEGKVEETTSNEKDDTNADEKPKNTDTKDSVEKKKESSENNSSKPDSKDDSEKAAEGPKLASWEKRWMEKVEVTPTRDLSSLTATPEEQPDDTASSSTNAKTSASNKKEEPDPDTELLTKEVEASSQALRQKLKQQRMAIQEFWIRQLVLIVLGLIAAMRFSTMGTVMEVMGAAQNADSNLNKDSEGFFDDDMTEEIPVTVGTNLEPFTIPFVGALSIPMMVLLLRISLHYGMATMNAITPSLATCLGEKPQPGFMLNTAMTFVPALRQVVDISYFFKSIVEDAIVFVVVFVNGVAISQLMTPV